MRSFHVIVRTIIKYILDFTSFLIRLMHLAIYPCLLEYHIILSQRSSFITENELYLTQFFNQVRGSDMCGPVVWFVVHFKVLHDKIGQRELHDFECDVQ